MNEIGEVLRVERIGLAIARHVGAGVVDPDGLGCVLKRRFLVSAVEE